MALTMIYRCACGINYHLYIPKRVIFGEIMGSCEQDWIQVDIQEERAGEIDVARKHASMIGSRFVDYRDNQITICNCGAIIDIRAIMAEGLRGGVPR